MQTYSFETPPPLPGVYALRYKPTGGLYIGRSVDLQRRYQEWKYVVTTGYGARSALLSKLTGSSSAVDWEFVVLRVAEGATDAELSEVETKVIEAVGTKKPHLLLNTIAASVPKAATPTAAKSVILNGGTPISYAEAARLLGVQRRQIEKRMKRWRDRNMHQVELSDLKTLSEKFRPPKNPL